MNLLTNDVFEKSLGEFLSGRLKETNWVKDKDSELPIIYSAEVTIPVVVHHTDKMHAESMVIMFEEFFKELYDKLEVGALELMAGKNYTISERWKNAADEMAQLLLRLMTDPFYAQYLNETYPPKSTGFGKKMIVVYGRAAIYEKYPNELVMMFSGSAASMIQHDNKIHSYKFDQNLVTIY